jgi:shikimate dehydrogenase
MRQFGLIGYPLSHSFSKNYFTEKFEMDGLFNCSYENFSIASITELTALIKNNPLLEGLNITIPYKEQVLGFLYEQSEIVQKIKACNCVKISSGNLIGYNTDVVGFELSLKKQLRAYHKNALILGTGGAGKAVEYVLTKLGIQYKYVSREASAKNYSYTQLVPSIFEEYKLIINTTPLGMYPDVNAYPPIPYECLDERHYLFDAIYNPGKTVFLQKGEAQGAAIKNGLEMLIIQAEESWKIWNET